MSSKGSRAGSKAGSKAGTPRSSKPSTPKVGSKSGTPLPGEKALVSDNGQSQQEAPVEGEVMAC